MPSPGRAGRRYAAESLDCGVAATREPKIFFNIFLNNFLNIFLDSRHFSGFSTTFWILDIFLDSRHFSGFSTFFWILDIFLDLLAGRAALRRAMRREGRGRTPRRPQVPAALPPSSWRRRALNQAHFGDGAD